MPKKIIAIQVAPECTDTSTYYDGDCFTKASGDLKYCILVPPSRRDDGYNTDVIKDFQSQMEDLYDAFADVAVGDGHYYKNYKDAMLRIIGSYNPSMCSKLKAFMPNMYTDYNDVDTVIAFMNIVTPYHWETVREVGYSQGEVVTIIYTKAGNSEQGARMFARAWIGTLTEFTFEDCDESCVGYFVPDEMAWGAGNDLVIDLANQYGCKPNELEVKLIETEKTIVQRTYKTLTLTA